MRNWALLSQPLRLHLLGSRSLSLGSSPASLLRLSAICTLHAPSTAILYLRRLPVARLCNGKCSLARATLGVALTQSTPIPWTLTFWSCPPQIQLFRLYLFIIVRARHLYPSHLPTRQLNRPVPPLDLSIVNCNIFQSHNHHELPKLRPVPGPAHWRTAKPHWLATRPRPADGHVWQRLPATGQCRSTRQRWRPRRPSRRRQDNSLVSLLSVSLCRKACGLLPRAIVAHVSSRHNGEY